MNEKTQKSRDKPLDETVTYNIDGKTFIVEPIFHTEGKETLGEILLKLMKSEKAANPADKG